VFKSSLSKFSLLLGSCVLVGFGLWKVSDATSRIKPASIESDGLWTTVLVEQKGDKPIDYTIRRLQDEARFGRNRAEVMKRLGWAFISKARLSYDPGYYKFAEQCALFVQSQKRDDPDALLLQGHILHSSHKFKEAESIARKLIAVRNEASDQALLGDVLMEQGQLDQALMSYQSMINLRPNLQSYIRVAHMRWLKGDLEGAIEVMQTAVTASSSQEPEASAWAFTRLGIYGLQAGDLEMAARSAGIALEFAQNDAAALLLRARVLLAQGKPQSAVPLLETAATITRLPEYQWALADALREVGKPAAAQEIEKLLIREGQINDPRTLSLYLATRGQQIPIALKLADEELKTRSDVFTMDALAWGLKASGRLVEARWYSEKSLKEGTKDARLLYHAGSIAAARSDYVAAREFFRAADRIKQTLMPSERNDLNNQFAALAELEKHQAISCSN
jgi:tetratricopeptide (TPR) repeat protein